jgi:hypothetical protein
MIVTEGIVSADAATLPKNLGAFFREAELAGSIATFSRRTLHP